MPILLILLLLIVILCLTQIRIVPQANSWIVEALGKKKGIDTSSMTGVDYQTFKESQYDILAAELRKHLDMDAIYRILNEGI